MPHFPCTLVYEAVLIPHRLVMEVPRFLPSSGDRPLSHQLPTWCPRPSFRMDAALHLREKEAVLTKPRVSQNPLVWPGPGPLLQDQVITLSRWTVCSSRHRHGHTGHTLPLCRYFRPRCCKASSTSLVAALLPHSLATELLCIPIIFPHSQSHCLQPLKKFCYKYFLLVCYLTINEVW